MTHRPAGEQPPLVGKTVTVSMTGEVAGPDRFGGWSCEVRQVDWGHRAEKRTWLYIVGAHPDDLPELPPRGEATALVVSMPECRHVELMGKAEREHTPPAFAEWLVELARRTRIDAARHAA